VTEERTEGDKKDIKTYSIEPDGSFQGKKAVKHK
jgi:hypothetical protein